MSSSGLWAEDQGSRPHQRIRRTSMQAAKMSEEDGVWSSQPSELEDEPSQAKTTKRCMLVSRDEVRWLAFIAWLVLVVVVVVGLVLASNMFPLWLQNVRNLLVLMTMLLMLAVLLHVTSGLSEDGVSSQQPELEDKSSQAKTAKSGIHSDAVLRVLLLLGVALGSMFLLLQGKLTLQKSELALVLLALVLLLLLALLPVVLEIVPLQTLERFVNFFERGGRLVKWGPHEWVLDSGAWNHHTSNLALLLEGGDFESQELDNKDDPSSGDDATPHVQRRGSVRTDCFDFPGVHYVVGDDTRNVVSVSQLALDHGLVTVFEPTSCHVKDKKTGKIVGKGHLRNGMYMLDSLHIVGQHIRDGGASGGDRHDGADGGGGSNGDGDSTAEGRGGGRDGRRGEGGTRARNQEESSGSGAAEGDVNEINEEGEGGDEKEIEEMNENDEDDIKEIGEINGKGEKEDDEKRGGQNSRQLSSRPYAGLFRLSRFDCILWIISILCIAACILQPYTGWGAGVTILALDFHSLVAGFLVLFILSFQLFKTWMSTICKEEEKLGPYYLQGLSHQEQNKRLFGLSRFDAITDPTGYHLPAGAFPASSTNAARREEFLVDSGASFHATWNECMLVSYPQRLEEHTKPPTRRFGGVVGSMEVKRSGYLSTDKIKLDGLLLAPDSRMNLVSVGQLSIQYDVKVEMDDEGVVIKKKQDGAQIGGGKMLNNHQYVLEYFQPPEDLFAHRDTPHFKIFGTRRPGLPVLFTVPCPSRSTTTEETGADSEETGAGRESRGVRMRRPNTLVTGPMWSC